MKTIGIAAVAALLFVGSTLSAQAIYSFESCPPGPLTTCSPAEPWATAGGIITVVPFGAIGTTVSGFPTDSVQWAIVHAMGALGGTGPNGGFTVPANGPAPFPFPSGSTGNLSIPITIPNPPAGVSFNLIFAYTYVTPECPNDPSGYNDFFTVDFTSGGASLANILYIDTFSTTLVAPALSPHEGGAITAGWCPSPGPLEVGPPGAPKLVSFPIPSNFYGQTVTLEFNIGNGNDTSLPSWAYVDGIGLQSTGNIPAVMLSQSGPGAPVFVMNSNLMTGNEYYNAISVDLCSPVGSGPYLGLCFNDINFALLQLSLPVGIEPFHFVAAGPTTNFGAYPLPATLTLDVIVFDVTGGILGAYSQVTRYTVQ